MQQQQFKLASGTTVTVEVKEHGDCITVCQLIQSKNRAKTKTCTVTCGSTGKSISWTCPEDKNCVGDCRDPENPKGGCV